MHHFTRTNCALIAIIASVATANATTEAATSDPRLPDGILLIEAQTATAPLELVFADANAQPLYNPADSGFQCTEECLQTWRPAPASEGAQVEGDWSTIEGPGGIRQWAYRGRPLYTYTKEMEVGVYPGGSVGEVRRRWEVQATGDGVDDIWSVAKPAFAETVFSETREFPNNIKVEEAVMAPGFILVTADKNDPLYLFKGSVDEERNLPKAFHPVAAGMLELPVGDFTVRQRWDGTMQWAYQGFALFTYAGDHITGDLNGQDVVAGIVPATVYPLFQPNKVDLKKDERRGGYFVEAETGKVLYACDRHHYPTSSYNSRILNRGNPVVGKILGVSCCDEQCESDWQPLLASADARANGYWSVYERPDGEKQWAYRGYALYSYRQEPPGAFYGEEQWSYNFSTSPEDNIDETLGLGTFFRVAVP